MEPRFRHERGEGLEPCFMHERVQGLNLGLGMRECRIGTLL